MVIAQKLIEQGADAQQLLAKLGVDRVKVEIVKAQYGAGQSQRDVTKVLQQQVRDLPLIPLTGNYNKSFGGDPAPNSAKQLKVEYRIDGRPGQAAFPENAVIMLPMPSS